MNEDLRDSFFDKLVNYLEGDDQVVYIANDMEVQSLLNFKRQSSTRYINVGVAEQNMVNVAAGLASVGKKVVVFGILSFLTARCYEQLKLNVAQMNLPILFVGIGTGITYSYDGFSHHSISDISIVRQLPNFEIFTPSSRLSAGIIAREVADFSRPRFVRLDKGIPDFELKMNVDATNGLIIYRENVKNCILFTGTVSKIAYEVFLHLTSEGKQFGLVEVIKNWPLSNQLKNLLAQASNIIVIEENIVSGGLFNSISEECALGGSKANIVPICLKPSSKSSYGSRNWLRQEFGLASNLAMQTMKQSFLI